MGHKIIGSAVITKKSLLDFFYPYDEKKYDVVNISGRKIHITNMKFKDHIVEIYGYVLYENNPIPQGGLWRSDAQTYTLKPYLKEKEPSSSPFDKFKYVHFIPCSTMDTPTKSTLVAEFTNHETLGGALYSLEIK